MPKRRNSFERSRATAVQHDDKRQIAEAERVASEWRQHTGSSAEGEGDLPE